MRKFAWLIPALALAFAAPVFAEDAPKKEKKAPAEKAEKVVKKVAKLEGEKVALGELKLGEAKDVEIKLKNSGEGDAKAVTCTGGGITWGKEKVDIAAGADGTIKGSLKAVKKGGKKVVEKTAKVTCGKGKAAAKIDVTYSIPAAEVAAKPEKAEKK